MTRFVSEIERELQDHYRPDRQTSLTVSLPQGLAEKLAGVARGLGYTTTRFAAQLLTAAYSARYGNTGDSALEQAVANIPAASALEQTIVGTATKALDHEVDGLKRELATAATQIETLREAAKGQLVVVNQAKSALADLNACRRELDQCRSEVSEARARADALLEQIEASSPAFETAPPLDDLPVSPAATFTAKRRKEIRQWLAFGMNRAAVATSLGLTITQLDVAIKEPS